MKFILILFFAVLAIASAQRRIRVLHPSHRLHRVADKDHYYASLGRGDVSSYSRSHVSRNLGRLGGYRETHVSGDRFNNSNESTPNRKLTKLFEEPETSGMYILMPIEWVADSHRNGKLK
ncbi:hypothetical protein TNIN_195931 [Trichonephila inaurata madagascariensis]|uniref:Uncharacterized protein n=1 Tax=Trichonephila inaurata madagascariensis TaxID=2747483 RepID=A0A8X6YF11_9ARAC|nr:hypothetical protein TNIN_195931 [Trichonephila inaurata madagascariensis]